ncbi:MAG: hypothetical protein AB1757_28255 [Acidobacteriota bacterium]
MKKGLLTIMVVAFAIYINAITPLSFGFYHDDAVYVATAKSLATDQGYRIISLPGEPVQTKSPPLHPFLLSLIWRVNPTFPDNIPAMMSLSAIVSLLSFFIIWYYLTKQDYSSKLIAVITIAVFAINLRTIILSSGIYVEMFYTAISIGALYLAEEYEKKEWNWVKGIFVGVIIGLGFLTRSTGITILWSVVLYYFFRGKLRRGLIPITIGCALIATWVIWGYMNKPTDGGANAAYYESYFQTLNNVIQDAQVQTGQSYGVTFLSIIGKNILMLVVVSIPLTCLGMPYSWIQNYSPEQIILVVILLFLTLIFTIIGFIRQISSKGFRLLHFYVLTYLALQLIWPYSAYDRFLVPILPFLILFLILELLNLAMLLRKEVSAGLTISGGMSVGVIFIIISVIIGFGATYYGLGVYYSVTSLKKKYIERANEDLEAIYWLTENTEQDDILMCYRDPLYYLYTNRKAIRSSPLKDGGKIVGNQSDLEEKKVIINNLITKNNVKYLILTSTDLELESQADEYQKAYKLLIKESPHLFFPVFTSSDGRCVIYLIQASAK